MKVTAVFPKEYAIKAGFSVSYSDYVLYYELTGYVIDETPRGLFIRDDNHQTRFIPTRFITDIQD